MNTSTTHAPGHPAADPASAGDGPSAPAAGTVAVWDAAVRLLHWGLAAAFVTSYLTGEEVMNVHLLSGYAIIAIVGLRAAWGLFGPKHARFDDFVPGPVQVVGYLRDLIGGKPKRHLGHNPLGGAMTVALLAALLATTGSGLYMLSAGEAAEDLHEVLANTTLALVLLHVGGVVFSSLLHRENLPLAMVTGRKRTGSQGAGRSAAP